MRETTSTTPNELANQMLNQGADCGIQLLSVEAIDHREQVLVACFRNPAGAERLLIAVHLLCEYWINQGLASADDFRDLLEQELAGQDPHH